MNTLTRSVLTTTFTLIAAITNAQSYNVTADTLVDSITKDNLVTAGSTGNKTQAQKVLRKLSYGVPPGIEGVPGEEEEISADDIMQQDYPLSLFLRETLQEAETRDLGPRLAFYERQVVKVIQRGDRPNEEAVRLVLNRSVDVVQNIIKWAGLNSEMIQQYLNQYYAQNFEIALGYANNPPAREEQVFPRAKVGIFVARMLYQNHGGMISDSAKAIILVKLLGYLGQDLNSDLQRRTTIYSVPLRKIINIQQEDEAYHEILASLKAKQEPSSPALASLRTQIGQILKSLPNN